MTITTDSSGDSQPLILKTDSKGRVLTPAHRREALLDEFEKSGLSGMKFAALSGVKYQTFATWVQRRQRTRGQSDPSEPKSKRQQVAWLEAVVQQAQDADCAAQGVLILHLPGGARAELTNTREVALVAALLRALDRPC
jgi:transposase